VSTIPGCRMPHFFVDGRSSLDLLGPDYTLFQFDDTTDVEPLLAAAKVAGLPLEHHRLKRPQSAAFCTKLLIVRSDQHVAWRGDESPSDAGRLVAKLAGKPVS